MFIEKLGLKQDILSDRVAIITGAGRGIGKELARSLAWLGAKVVIAEINDSGKDVEKLINSEAGKALFIRTDISKEEDIKNLEKVIIEKFGRIDILINNAYYSSAGEIKDLDIKEWDKAYNVNIRGAIMLIKTFLPYMLKKNTGVINTVTSAEGMPYMAPYFATKSALTSIGKSLAAELDETNISVFIFGPGMIDTPGLREAVPKIAPMYGMSVEEFMNQGVNPGYDGLMPAEHCAAGWAYTIVHAKDYHGQFAEPFSTLLKLGLINQEKKGDQVQKTKIEKKKDIKKLITQTIDIVNDVGKIVENVEKETKNLGLMARKWMNRIFAKRIGMKIESCVDLIREIEINIQILLGLIQNNKKEEANNIIKKFPWYIQVSKKLENHFNKCIDDAKGWIKDTEELNVAIEALTYREKTLQSLKNRLNIIYESI